MKKLINWKLAGIGRIFSALFLTLGVLGGTIDGMIKGHVIITPQTS